MGTDLNGKEFGAGLSQQEDGKYRYRFKSINGKKVDRTANTLASARRFLKQAMIDDEKHHNLVQKNCTLNEWYEVWITVYKSHLLKTSLNSLDIIYNRIRIHIGWRILSELTLAIMQNAINQIERKASKEQCKIILVDILDRAVDSKLIMSHEARNISVKSERDYEIYQDNNSINKALSDAEVLQFLDCIRNHSRLSTNYHITILGLETGLRIGEICGLQWSDISFSEQKLSVKRSLAYIKKSKRYNVDKSHHVFHLPKTDTSIRCIPLTQKALSILQQQKEYCNNVVKKLKISKTSPYYDMVFLSKIGTPIKPSIVEESFADICAKYKIEKVTPHMLRHTFATNWVRYGGNIKSLQTILGHRNIKTTMDTYCHASEDINFTEMKRVEAISVDAQKWGESGEFSNLTLTDHVESRVFA